MIRRLILLALILGLAACVAAPPERDGGIGGTGAAEQQL